MLSKDRVSTNRPWVGYLRAPRLLSLLTALIAVSIPMRAHPQRLVPLSRAGASGPNEVSVAIDPSDPRRIVAVSMQRLEGIDHIAYVSHDAGQHFEELPGPNPSGRTQGDDAIRFDAEGRAFWSYISFAGLRVEQPPVAANGIFLNRSSNGGRDWETTTVVDHINTVMPFEDKPYLAIDMEESSPHRGAIYIAWTRFSRYGSSDPRETSDIYLSVSRDHGVSFSMPQRVSDEPGDAIDSDGTLEGAVPVIAPNGDVILVWAGPQGLVVDRSDDGGSSFGKDRHLIETPGGWDIDVPGIFRANGMPVTAVDRSGGPWNGRLYVNWVDERSGSLDVYVIHSSDLGASWSAPIRVHAESAPRDQFLSWMAVDGVDGSVNVVFYDRTDLNGTLTGVTLARSVDGGQTFVTHPIAPGLMDPFATQDDVFFGDYIGVDALDGRVVVAFTHFVGERRLALSAAIFDFVPKSQTLR